jgi:hypothetical protein
MKDAGTFRALMWILVLALTARFASAKDIPIAPNDDSQGAPMIRLFMSRAAANRTHEPV